MLVNSEIKDSKVVEMLQEHLSDLHLVYSHLHNFHWNIEGPHFFEYHEKLQEMYEDVAEKIDETAERLLMIGDRPMTKLSEYVQTSELSEFSSETFNTDKVVQLVLGDLNHLIKKIRSGIKLAESADDQGTIDFLIEMLRDHEKMRWFWSAAAD